MLVVGAAQYAIGAMRRADRSPERSGWAQLAGWNAGSVLVIALRGALAGEARLASHDCRVMLLVLALSIPIGILLLSHLRN